MNISSLNGIFANSNKLVGDTLAATYGPLNNANNANQSAEEHIFSNMVTNEIEKLNAKQIEADELTQSFISGQGDDLHTVLIATEEARLSLELAVQVRNKCVEAYKEINNIQL